MRDRHNKARVVFAYRHIMRHGLIAARRGLAGTGGNGTVGIMIYYKFNREYSYTMVRTHKRQSERNAVRRSESRNGLKPRMHVQVVSRKVIRNWR